MAVEHWLNGPVHRIPTLLQPVAHALLQSRDEVKKMMSRVEEEWIWEKPGGMASIAFHLQHLVGVLDRLFTYAKGEELSQVQLDYLKKEGSGDTNITVALLVAAYELQVDQSILQLQTINESTLTSERFVGRKRIASTQIGLLVHAAEHSMRHTGQLLVTIQWLKEKNEA